MRTNRLPTLRYTKYALARFLLLLSIVICPYEYRLHDHLFRANDTMKRRARLIKRSYAIAKAKETK